ncbi:nucleotide sugar dehydrogenase [Jannaschia sp. W003]|uniref:nucleotide sugar dehydrogenase n=1 Tax=Jannaschia sp. W003 TaxID=2867012 RepID=UPI0021A41C53|nr:nucleotide sugar dehydrogenase [Jannaschia sp. W003]UWQ23106.1 nucleotide sugar dehydrogenase [Jannaschia sp. W003]
MTSPLAIIGLGYVGLPLAVEFGRRRPVIGFDISEARIEALRAGHDATLEVSDAELAAAEHLEFTTDRAELARATTFIVTVPTPIDRHKRPDLTPLVRASETVGAVLKPGDTVIYESTVYPGATEEDCVPVLERVSGLRLNEDFTVGYSPERINPGDHTHRLPDILKVTSGSTPEAAERIDALYASIITAGTHRAPSIRVAEAAKVIENTQRDLNIALVNELAVIFERLGIDTEAVLQAAGTKWNFLPFRPGLVGGHCIGVDPYYLTHRAQAAGHHPEIILAGRRLNDAVGGWVASRLVKALLGRGRPVKGARALVLGLTFKEDCPDTRNTRVTDVVTELEDYGMAVDVHDPWAEPDDAAAVLGRPLCADPEPGAYDAVVLAVAHRQFREMGADAIRGWCGEEGVLFDLKYVLPPEASDLRM